MFHLYVNSAFFNGTVQEELCVEQPEGFQFKSDSNKVYRLHKPLYALKQTPRSWYSKIEAYLLKQGFVKSPNEATLYVCKVKGEPQLIISLYVDDLLVTGKDDNVIHKFKSEMMKHF